MPDCVRGVKGGVKVTFVALSPPLSRATKLSYPGSFYVKIAEVKQIAPVLFALAIVPCGVAHPGGLDAKGGHIDRKDGSYHYHGAAAASTPKASTTAAAKAPAPNPAKPVATAAVAEASPTPAVEVPRTGPKISPLAKITIGMTKAEVLSRLGEPSVKSESAWYYLDTGFVRFKGDAVNVIESL